MRHWFDKNAGKPKIPKPGSPEDDEDVDENEDVKKRKYDWDEIVKKLNARYKGA